MTVEEQKVRDCLLQLIDEFTTNALSARTMRGLAKETPGLFAPVAAAMLITATDAPGYRHLATLLVQQPGIFKQLADPAIFTRAQAVAICRRLIAVEPSFDIRFAHQLPARADVNADTLVNEYAEQALEILDEISAGRLIVPILNHLVRHPDCKISSKAALLIGKRVQNIAFAQRLIKEGTDPRVRANAIEAVWGSDSPAAKKLFWDCIEDRHNRVVGNAMVGLFLAGDPAVSAVIKRFARDYKPEFRITSAWAMGRTGDAGFILVLSPLLTDTHPGVRSAALRSLQTIRQIEKVRRPSEIVAEEELPVEYEAIPTVTAETEQRGWHAVERWK